MVTGFGAGLPGPDDAQKCKGGTDGEARDKCGACWCHGERVIWGGERQVPLHYTTYSGFGGLVEAWGDLGG